MCFTGGVGYTYAVQHESKERAMNVTAHPSGSSRTRGRREPVYTEQLVACVRPEHRAEIARLAAEGGRTLASETRRAIEAWLDKVGAGGPAR